MSSFLIACRSGNLKMVKYIISSEYNEGLKVACEGGHIKIVKYLVSQGAVNFNDGLKVACREGHLNIVKYLIKQGADNVNEGLCCACSGGHLDIVKYLVEQGADNLNDGLCEACSENNLHLVEYMVECGANNFDGGLYYTTSADIIKFLIEKSGSRYNTEHLNIILEYVCEKHNLDAIKYLLERGADKLELIPWAYTQSLLNIGTNPKLLDPRSTLGYIYNRDKRISEIRKYLENRLYPDVLSVLYSYVEY